MKAVVIGVQTDGQQLQLEVVTEELIISEMKLVVNPDIAIFEKWDCVMVKLDGDELILDGDFKMIICIDSMLC